MMTLKEFLSVNHANFQVGVRNDNNKLKKIIDTVFYGEENGFNELKLRDYLYDYVVDIKMISPECTCAKTSYLAVIVLHEDEDEDEGKEND